MKTILTLFILFSASLVFGQNWYTVCGNNQKNGLTKMTGPVSIGSPYWTATSPNNTVWGNAVYTFGNKFVSSRGVLSPYRLLVEMRDLTTGALIWQKTVNDTARLYAVGFTEDAVYAVDYQGSTTTILYALTVDSGNVKWSLPVLMFPGNTGICFAPDGDPIIFGKRLDRKTGAVKWAYNYTIPASPDGGYVVSGNTYYHWTGSLSTPKKLIAVDINTGLLKYQSDALPGAGDQENDLVIGPDGTIYIARDNGSLHAFIDNGSGFTQKWALSPAVLPKSFGPNNTIYCANINFGVTRGTLMRVDGNTGSIIDSIPTVTAGYVTVGYDSTVYVNNGATAGKLYAFTPDLQTIKWQMDLASTTYLGFTLGKEGVFVAIGAGNQITAYKPTISRKPVADFRSSGRDINTSQTINFFDQSSYSPTSWNWTFTGGTPSSSTSQNPTGISYSAAGIYEVKLAAVNSFGADTITRTSYVFVNNPTVISGNENTNPNEFKLEQNYPNPFNPTTNIKFSMSNLQFVTLKVYDMLGKEVTTLVKEKLTPGTYSINWNAAEYPSGVYFYKIITGGYSETKRMLLLK
jgi:PKD repeat protein